MYRSNILRSTIALIKKSLTDLYDGSIHLKECKPKIG